MGKRVNMRRVNRAAVYTAALALAMGAIAVPAGSAQHAEPTGTAMDSAIDDAYTVFGEPIDGDDTAIEDELVELVNNTPAGASIHGAMYSWNREPVADALADAQERGVDVHLAVDWEGYNGTNADPENAAIDTLEKANLTEFVLCNDGDDDSSACISAREDSINHNKTFTFSETGEHQNAVYAASHNLTPSQNANFNDAVIVAGDRQLYEGFVGYLTALRAEDKDNDFFNTPAGQVESSAGDVVAKFSPRADSDGGTDEDASTDTIVDALDKVTAQDGCKVDVAHAQFTSPRAAVADELIRLSEAGCTVRVAGGSNLTDPTKEKFDGTDVEVRQDDSLHSKYMVVRGTIDGETDRALVLAGSHNLNRPALRVHDETSIQVELGEIVADYEDNFEVIWQHLA